MDYLDEPFPERIAFGAQSEPMWFTDVATTFGGQEATNQNWSQVRHAFDVTFAIRTATDYADVRAHFHMARGRAKKFRFKDFLDYEATSAPLTATATPNVYQCYKRYGSGSDAYDRIITRPVEISMAIFRTRASVTTNITGSSTIDDETGLVTVTGHVGGDTYTWSGEFDVPCRYDTDRLPARAISKNPQAGGDLIVESGTIMLIEVRET